MVEIGKEDDEENGQVLYTTYARAVLCVQIEKANVRLLRRIASKRSTQQDPKCSVNKTGQLQTADFRT